MNEKNENTIHTFSERGRERDYDMNENRQTLETRETNKYMYKEE